MACCDDCAKSGGKCGDKKSVASLAHAWNVGGMRARARVGAYATPEAEDAWRQGVTTGFVGGAATVAGVLGALWLMRGR
jgi:hypothetical protein